MPREKRSRTVRAKGRAVVLTERDQAVLSLIAVARYIARDQIARDCFPSEDRCRRRLRQLYDSGLVSIVLYDSTRPDLVTLTRRGLETLTALVPTLATVIRLPGPIRTAAIPHHLASIDARLYAAAIGEKRGAPLTAWESGSGRLAQELGLPSWHLTPDALAEYTLPEGEVIVIAVEVDCGATEPLKTIASKLERYQGVAAEGLVDALWFVVTSGAVRQANIEALIAAAGLSEWARVLDHAFITSRPVEELPAGGGGRERAAVAGPTTAAGEDAITEHYHADRAASPASEGRADRRADGRGARRGRQG